MTPISVGLVDDHQLFLKSLALMVNSFPGCTVTVEALNGIELQVKLQAPGRIPDIMLIDVNMPQMDGIATTAWLRKTFPATHLVALSMQDTDKSIITMLKAGCCAYLLKDTHPNDLEKALHEIRAHGYYNADASNINYRRLLMTQQEEDHLRLNTRESRFLQLACSELTYKQIAAEMFVSERTVDGYRESLFQKFRVQSRVGLCLEAIRRELVTLK
jgi:DNA-binding NarL/FixJ family response regulator